MTKAETRDLYLSLNKLGNKKGVKFAYGVSRNVSLLKPEMDSLDKAVEATPEFKAFDEKRIELVKKHSKKDDKGNPVMKNQNDYDIEDLDAFNKAFEDLKSDNQEVFDTRIKQLEEFTELMKSESEVKLFKISLDNVPEDITVTEMYSLRDIIEEAVPSPYGK